MFPTGPRTISERSKRVPKRLQQGCPTDLKPSLEQRFCIIFHMFLPGFRARSPRGRSLRGMSSNLRFHLARPKDNLRALQEGPKTAPAG
eukprot:1668627-Pyramimonas_sp.AAC.1